MKNTKQILKKTLVANAILFAAGMANAQWAVTDNTTHQLLGQVYNQLGKVATNQSVQISQQDQLNYSADQRNRIAMGQADIARRDFEQLPTLQQCVERTQQRSKTSAFGGGSSANNRVTSPAGRKELDRPIRITSAATALAPIVESRVTMGTCTKYDVDAGIAQCSAEGAFSGADTSMIGITRNIENGPKDAAGNRQQVNMTLSDKGYEVALKNINDAVYGNAPGLPDPQKTAKNPVFKAMYDALMIKLHSAQVAMNDVARTFANSPTPPQNWGDNRAKWTTLFPGEQFPPNPSKMDLYRFETFQYFFKEDELFKSNKEADVAKRTNDLLALNNMLAFEQLRVNQNNSIILSNILVQLTTPINHETVKAEMSKTNTLR